MTRIGVGLDNRSRPIRRWHFEQDFRRGRGGRLPQVLKQGIDRVASVSAARAPALRSDSLLAAQLSAVTRPVAVSDDEPRCLTGPR